MRSANATGTPHRVVLKGASSVPYLYGWRFCMRSRTGRAARLRQKRPRSHLPATCRTIEDAKSCWNRCASRACWVKNHLRGNLGARIGSGSFQRQFRTKQHEAQQKRTLDIQAIAGISLRPIEKLGGQHGGAGGAMLTAIVGRGSNGKRLRGHPHHQLDHTRPDRRVYRKQDSG